MFLSLLSFIKNKGGVNISNIDYGIIKICRESGEGHIRQVIMKTMSTGDIKTWYKHDVVSLIKRGDTIYTCPEIDCSKGAQVNLYTFKGADYLRSDKDKTPKDNLENLPSFC